MGAAPLNDRQRAVLDWIAAGCPAGEEPVPTYKHSASALASRGLIDLDNRYGTPWRARLTARGRYWLEHGAYPPVGMVLEPLIEVDDTPGEEVSDAEFVNRRRVLRSDWDSGGQALTYLELSEQWALHAAYQPTKESTEQQALADFREFERSTPEKAAEAAAAHDRYGHARERVQQDVARAQAAKEAGIAPRKRPRKERNLSVRTLARPEPDVAALARVLVELAIKSVEADEQKHGATSEDDDPAPRPSKASETLRQLPLMRGESAPLATRRTSRTPSPTARVRRRLPATVATKLREAQACHQAGTHLAAVLVARAAITDALDHAGAPSAVGLPTRLDWLVQDGQLNQDLAVRAAGCRPMVVVPSSPEVTAAESETLLDIAERVVTSLYPAERTP